VTIMKHSSELESLRQRLDTYLAQDEQGSFLAAVRRRSEDQLRPRTKDGRFRPSAIVVLVVVLTMLSILTFAAFTVVRP
jgi:hypothetical protein